MENASKALLMGASVIVAILIIFLATRLFRAAFGVANSYDKAMETSEISAFNTNFTKYAGAVVNESSGTEQKYATIYDVISTANFAYDYNSKNIVNPKSPENPNDPIILHVNLQTSDGNFIIKDLQNHDELYYNLIQKCHYIDNANPTSQNIVTYEITINSYNATGKINEVTFRPIEPSANEVVEKAYNILYTAP